MKDHQENRCDFLLRFEPLFGTGSALSFPCDSAGTVDLDRLGERARCNYFYARTVIGREFAMPAVLVKCE